MGNDNPRMGNPSHGWGEEKKREICVYEYVYEYGKTIRTGNPLLLHVLLHSDLLTHVRRARYRRWGMGMGCNTHGWQSRPTDSD